MKCADCPFHMTCAMGRLGYPDILTLCPECTCLSFVLEQKYIDIGSAKDTPEALAETATAIETDLGITLVADPEVDPESILVTINGRRVMARVDGRAKAHLINFTCEQRPMTALWQSMFKDAMTQRHEEITRHGKTSSPGPAVINVEDPGPGNQSTFLIKKCPGCEGQFARAAEFYELSFYNLDNGDKLPDLTALAIPLEKTDEVR